jgi:pSer/pThr/pTyr-binding forkhead associated (FHA) protein
MAAQYQFVMRSGPTVGKTFPLDAQEVTIGRDAVNIVAINDGEVSRKHARMELRGAKYVIQDLGSTNGTFINGTRVSGMQELNPGDTVSFGEGIVLVYESIGDVNATILSSKPTAATVQKPAPVSVPTPAPAPAPTPAPTPAAAPVFSGQVPAGPVPLPPEPVKAKKKFPVWLIILIVLLVIILCCVGFFIAIDQLNLWCKVLPFLVPLLGGTCA